MSRTPFMPFYPDAYLADTAQLTLEEQGAYMRLLCYLWINCGQVVDNNKIIARMLGIHVNKWLKLRKTLGGYLVESSPGYLTQTRLQKEYSKSLNISERNRQNAHRRWDGNTLENNDSDDATASTTHMPKSYKAASDSDIHSITITNKYNYLLSYCCRQTCGKLLLFADALPDEQDFPSITVH
jgi:uncharacterized protein YdaU (DUF1376 family)